MRMKPYATDWVTLHRGVEHSIQLGLYWHNNQVYDELSASHNGLIGLGHQLKEAICKHSQEQST
jgi:hypothetical protein